jgi:hypothetical protein
MQRDRMKKTLFLTVFYLSKYLNFKDKIKKNEDSCSWRNRNGWTGNDEGSGREELSA